MNKKILAGMMALVLLLMLPVSAFAGEETDNDSATEATIATAPPTESRIETEPTQPSQPSEPTEPSESTPPSQPSIPAEQPEPTEPSAPTSPTTPASSMPTFLEIDTEHIYDGMDEAYEDGYTPRISGDTMHLVLPLLTNGNLYENEIKVSLGLGGSSGTPFIIANYEKSFELEAVTPINSEISQNVFLITFDVALSDKRTNGVYPVTVNVSGYDESNNVISSIYTIYVTITDGKSTEVKATYPEVATAEPVVYICNTTINPEQAKAGEEFTLTVTLKNSVTTKFVRNMLVTVDTGNVHIYLLENGNVFQIDKISAGGETELTLRFASDSALPAGKYPISFHFSYDSSKTLNLSSSGTTLVEIRQPANMELVMPRFTDSVTVGETIPLSLQVLNMGRDPMYNVRCIVSGFGFAPSNTGYIGTMAAGSSATTKVELYIIALNASPGNENGSQYGDTIGTVTLIYENENGEEFTQETTFDTTVNRPIVQLPQKDTTQEKQEATASQWWISVLILGGVICVAIICIILAKKKKKSCDGAYL